MATYTYDPFNRCTPKNSNGELTKFKGQFGQDDLAALSTATGDEFAMFTTGEHRMTMRGDETIIPIGVADAEVLTA